MPGVAPTVQAAVEGDLDAAVIARLLAEVGSSVGLVYGRNGKPHLLQKIKAWNNAARFVPWVVLVDLDRDCECAPPCRQRWLPQSAPHMCFRIAVRTVEAWLLADCDRIANFLRVARTRVPSAPESLHDPKQTLIELARRSKRRDIRDDLSPRAGSGRKVGPAYNSRLIEFVQGGADGWRPAVAAASAESLARCMEALRQLTRSGA